MKRTETKSTDWIAFERLPREFTIEAGIFEEKGRERKKPGKGQKAPSLSLIEIAAVHEFGALLKNKLDEVIGEIPQRSFLRAWFDANLERIEATLLRRLDVEGPANWERAVNQWALWIEAELKRNLRRGIPPPLADETIERKGSTKPLIDTGQLVNSIMAKVNGKAPL